MTNPGSAALTPPAPAKIHGAMKRAKFLDSRLVIISPPCSLKLVLRLECLFVENANTPFYQTQLWVHMVTTDKP